MNRMAEVIAALLVKHRVYVRNEDFGGVICDECGWEVASKWPEANFGITTTVRIGEHESHAALSAVTKLVSAA
ncbi:hypothetical protein LJ753_16705 [Arthrobacter sp. zg-Y20]|uniref:hypothetical protein n=1 Tax=unclassified Arthrobacter TaxID=235627 RepID=UPI001D15DEFA|nr:MULTISPECIES: hypothetical protein [unclassified Arthrobacter]MCC3277506.1 hypothetical protein [Arthrobacter sp. zg-Y20]MDK1317666.1 hypothetical protein [Arthrobacter sp. zg.Y20]WIB07074.1 hypothetical protein QNO06_04920 [Arthrobacter sp. zg-Y20]